jgi:hypothetical protein
MGSNNDEGVRGYWIGETLICKDCINKEEVERIKKENILTESNMDEGVDYICSRCKGEYKNQKKGRL